MKQSCAWAEQISVKKNKIMYVCITWQHLMAKHTHVTVVIIKKRENNERQVKMN